MKSAVAITGGYGYLGGRFAEFFSSTGHDVRLLARRASQRRPAWSHDMAVAELNRKRTANPICSVIPESASLHVVSGQ